MNKIIFILGLLIASVILTSCLEDSNVTGNTKKTHYFNESDFWEPTDGPYDSYVEYIWIDNKDHIYITCYEDYSSGHVLMKSTDEGKTWTNKTGIFGDSLGHIEFDRWSNIIAIYRNSNKFVMSTDDGKTWEQIADRIPIATFINFVKTDSKGILYASCNLDVGTALYRSNDKGKKWNMIMKSANVFLPPVDIAIDDNDVLYYLLNDDNNLGYIYISQTNGDIWSERIFPDATYSFIIDKDNNLYRNGNSISYNRGNSWYDFLSDGLYKDDLYEFYISPKRNLYKYSANHIFCSKDLGNSWSMILDASNIKKIAIDSKGYLYAVMNNGMINKTKRPFE